jgi:hypothetical protein
LSDSVFKFFGFITSSLESRDSVLSGCGGRFWFL